MFHRHADPGDCLICGAAHCGCGGGPIRIEQLPATAAQISAIVTATSVPLVSQVVQASLPAGSFTSGTYRGTKKKP